MQRFYSALSRGRPERDGSVLNASPAADQPIITREYGGRRERGRQPPASNWEIAEVKVA
jgi:hypothetical protein